MKRFLGWNIFLSYSENMDKEARKRGWAFLGYGKDSCQTEFRAYRMWKRSDKLKELEAEKKRKEKHGKEKEDASRRGRS